MEEVKSIFKKYRRQLAAEGWIKSLLCGLILGFSINLIFVLLLFITAVDLIWVSVVTCILTVGVTTALVYFKKFRPTAQKIAERVDRLGLEERMITMIELEHDDSYIAMRQREDAKAQLQKFKEQKLKISVVKAYVVLACAIVLISSGATTYTAFSFSGSAPTFEDMLDDPAGKVELIELSYEAGEGGFVLGEIYQILTPGQNGAEVLAVAEDGYMFDKWSDGVTTPSRTDLNVFLSMHVTAEFIQIPTPEDQVPPDDFIDMGQMEGEDFEMPGNLGTAGKYEEYNQVIDGNTYYRDVYQKYYEEALEILEAGGVVPEEMRELIEAYFGVIL